MSIEFPGFNLGFTAVASGLVPAYDSLVTFGPFNVTDSILEQFDSGELKVELHGSLPGSEQQRLLGFGSLSMQGLLRYGIQDTPNPVAGGVVAVRDPDDADVLVAKVRVKLRMRYSMEDLAEDFTTRARLRQQDRGKGSKKGRAEKEKMDRSTEIHSEPWRDMKGQAVSACAKVRSFAKLC